MNFAYDSNKKVYVLGTNEFTKEKFLQYVQNDMLQYQLSKENSSFDGGTERKEETSYEFIENYKQVIYYGVPGSGKSHKVDAETLSVNEYEKIRVVFHPDYANSDFIGQILPKSINGDVKYEFKPGPFSKILWRAIHNPQKKYFLIIEEINRGNASAIFGDIFQLLDRIKKESDLVGDNEKLSFGWSKYFIENDYLNNYLRNPNEYGSSSYTENHDVKSFKLTEKTDFTMNSGIRLPPNLAILATMNTSDQNVFTLDNAFQRRWDLELISNNLDANNEQYKLIISGTDITWGQFRDAANKMIASQSNMMGISSLEDTQLGAYFIQSDKDTNAINPKTFASKVLKYLWDDAFKLDRATAFKNKDSFEKSVMQYVTDQKLDIKSIFSEKFIKVLYGGDTLEETEKEDSLDN